METAIIQEVTERNDPQYGPEKVSKITLEPSGESRTAYTKPAVKEVYDNLRAGIRVELKAKPGGKGYWINKIMGEATLPAPGQPNGKAPAHSGPMSREEQGEYLQKKAGQYFYAYKCLAEKFGEGGIDVSEETLRQAAATILISLDRHI